MFEFFELGMWAIVAIIFLGVIGTIGLCYLAQKSLFNIHSLGIQSIIAANEMRIVDKSLEDKK